MDSQAGCNTPKPGGRLFPYNAEKTAEKQTYCQEASFLYIAVHIWSYSDPRQAGKPLLWSCPCWIWTVWGCQKQKNLHPLTGKLGGASQQSLSSPAPTGEKLFLLLLCSRHRGREPRQIDPDTAQVLPAQKATWKCHQAAGASSLCHPRGLLPGHLEGSLLCVPGLCPSSPRHSLPTALPSCSSPHPGQSSRVWPGDRAGRRHDLPAWQTPLKPNATAWCSSPCKLYVSKSQVPFNLSSIPFSCWVSFTQECQSTFHMPVCNLTSDSSSKQLLLYSLYGNFTWIFWYVLIFNCIRPLWPCSQGS